MTADGASEDETPNLYMRFDEDLTPCLPGMRSTDVCIENVGSGDDAPILGSLPTLSGEMEYTDGGKRLPTAPAKYPSSAPITSAGQPVVVMLNINDTVEVRLRSHDPDGDPLNYTITSTPRHGSLFDALGQRIEVGDRVVVDGAGGNESEWPTVLYIMDPSVPAAARADSSGDSFDNFS